MRLSVKLPLLIVSAVAAAAVAGGAIAISATQQSVRQEALRTDRHSLAVYVSALSNYLTIATSTLEATSSNPTLVGYRTAGVRVRGLDGVGPRAAGLIRDRARATLASSSVFEYVTLIDSRGRVFLVEPYALQIGTVRDDWSFLPWVRPVLSGGGTVISDLQISPVTGSPEVVIAVPIKDDRGRTIGAWAGSLRLTALSGVGAARGQDAAAGGFGYVTDGRGLVLAHQTNPNYVRYQTDFSSIPAVRAALGKGSGSGEWLDPIENDKKLGAWTALPRSRWAIVWSTSENAALAPARQLASTFTSFGIGLIVVLGSLSVVIGLRFVRPLRRLGDAAERVSAGDLSQRLEIAGNDEIAVLSTRFNAMVASLADKDAAVRDHAAALERANGELEAFSYSVSHDLRAPLRAIDGFSRALARRYDSQLDQEGHELIDRVCAAAGRMGELIDAMLVLSRITRRRLLLEQVDLSALARQVAGELQAGDHARDTEVVIEDGLAAAGDRELLRTALQNLLENAWKFTAGRDHARIEFASAGQNGRQLFVVRDNGAGFDMQYADKLFAPFERLHRQDEFEGTGVGLTTVQRIVRRHGGSVRGEGAVDQGAAFYFDLGDPTDTHEHPETTR
jgi:signal transduction histidine kinase